MVGKVGLPPLWLNARLQQRGQATLPDPEILSLELLLFSFSGNAE